MKIVNLKRKGTWAEALSSAMTTVSHSSVGEPSSSWKRRILLAEHSPIRQLIFKWKWEGLLWWVQTHFTRHHVGVEWWVQTSRTDRAGVDRTIEGSQSNLINVEGEANFQAIINISRRRLCNNASSETRRAWELFLSQIKEIEPELYEAAVPDCIYRGHCYEFNSCGYYLTEGYQQWLKEYRVGINERR